MEKPLVSIVTPCFNGESYLERFFRSVLDQTYPNLELVFINDGSTDGTEQVAERFRPLFQKQGINFIYEYQENAGQAAALNRGLKLFSGEYMNWMDSDDVIFPEFIKKRVEFMETHSGCAYCYGKVIVVNEEDPEKVIGEIGKRNSDKEKQFFEDILYVRDAFFPGYLVKTEALDRVIPNREIYTGEGGQNAQLLLPLAWYYGEPGYVEDSIYKYYVREQSHSHSQDSSEKVIQQLERYEKILISTIHSIPDKGAESYIIPVKHIYARLRFGNAVDTKNADLIRKYYRELKTLGSQKPHDLAMLIKYKVMSLWK